MTGLETAAGRRLSAVHAAIRRTLGAGMAGEILDDPAAHARRICETFGVPPLLPGPDVIEGEVVRGRPAEGGRNG